MTKSSQESSHEFPRDGARPRLRPRRGISLVEVVVAVALLSIMVTVHTLVTMRFAMRTRTASAGVHRSAAIATAADMFATMPYGSIATNTGCVTISQPAEYVHERCVTTTAAASAITRIRIIITPANADFRADTVQVDRTAPPAGSLFSS